MSPNNSRITRVRCLISIQAPIFKNLVTRWSTLSGFFPSSKTSRFPYGNSSNMVGISSSVRVHSTAATIDPAEAPDMILGRRDCSSSALSTPTWFMPNVAPPDRSSAVRPKAWRVFSNESKISRLDGAPSVGGIASSAFSVSTQELMYSSINRFVPVWECLYNFFSVKHHMS